MTETWWTIRIAYWFKRLSDMTVRECWNYAKQMDHKYWSDWTPRDAVETEMSYWSDN
jgi:hypothetical protein